MADTRITKVYDRLDRICMDRYGVYDSDTIQHVWDANPGLVKQGILLTPGKVINLPPLPTPVTDETPVIDQVRLWD